MKKLGLFILTALLACTLLAGCSPTIEEQTATTAISKTAVKTDDSSPSVKGEQTIKVGVSLLYKGDEWLAAMADEFTTQGQSLGYEVNIQDGNLDNEKQMQQVENFITQNYDVIVISAADAEGIIPAVEKAAAAGIPVIAVDTPINHEGVATTVAWDNYETGVKLGEYVKTYVQANYPTGQDLNMVIINAPSYPHLVKRDEGFLSVINQIPQIKIIATQDANGSRETAANIINNNIAKGIDLIYGVVDNHAWGAVTALEEAGAEKCSVFSCGGYGEEPFTALENNHPYYRALIVVPPQSVVEKTYEALGKVLKGEPIDKVTNADFGLADAENVAEFAK